MDVDWLWGSQVWNPRQTMIAINLATHRAVHTSGTEVRRRLCNCYDRRRTQRCIGNAARCSLLLPKRSERTCHGKHERHSHPLPQYHIIHHARFHVFAASPESPLVQKEGSKYRMKHPHFRAHQKAYFAVKRWCPLVKGHTITSYPELR